MVGREEDDFHLFAFRVQKAAHVCGSVETGGWASARLMILEYPGSEQAHM
jgi:hypothetical protein